MNLLCIWNDGYFEDSEAKKYLFNSKYDIKFNESEMKLYIEPNDNCIKGFLGRNIFDVMTIVGGMH